MSRPSPPRPWHPMPGIRLIIVFSVTRFNLFCPSPEPIFRSIKKKILEVLNIVYHWDNQKKEKK